MNKNNNSIDLYKKILLIVCTAITVVLTVIGYKKGIFTDETQMELFLNSCGIFAPLFFVFNYSYSARCGRLCLRSYVLGTIKGIYF